MRTSGPLRRRAARGTGLVLAASLVVGLGWVGGTVQSTLVVRAVDLAGSAAGPAVASRPAAVTPTAAGTPTVSRAEAAAAAAAARTAGVNGTLAVLNEALRTGDTSGLAGVVQPGATFLVRSLAADVAALRAVPFTKVAYRWAPSRWTSPDATWRTLPEGSIVAEVERVYSLGDPAPVVEPVEMVFTPHPGAWLLADKPEPADGVPPEPWWTGPLVAERAGSVLVLGDARDRKRLRDVGRLVDREWAATRTTWRLPAGRGPLVVYATRSAWFQQAWLGSRGDVVHRPDETDDAKAPTTFVGAVVPRATDGGDDGPAVLRVMLGAEVVKNPSSFASRATVSHELVHVATGLVGSGSTVAWLTEGVADLQSGTRLADGFDERRLWRGFRTPERSVKALRAGSWKPELVVRESDFYTGEPEAVAVRYHDALVAAIFLRDTYGDKKLDRFVRQALVNDGTSREVETAYSVALKKVYGLDQLTLDAKVAAYGNAAARRYGLTTD